MIQYELNICLNIYENHNLCIKDRTYILEPSSTEEASIFEPAIIIENWKKFEWKNQSFFQCCLEFLYHLRLWFWLHLTLSGDKSTVGQIQILLTNKKLLSQHVKKVICS